MKKKSEIMEISNGLFTGLGVAFADLAGLKKEEAKAIVKGSYDEAHAAVESVKNSIEITAKGTDVDGISVHQFLSTFKSFEENGKLAYVELTIKSKLKAQFPFHATTVIRADENFIANMCDAYKDAMIQLLYIQLGGENLNELNDLIATICAENEIPMTFGFTLSDSKNYIISITDEKVVFNAVVAETLELSKNALFQAGDEYSDRVREVAIENLVDSLKALQTTPQIVKSGIAIISTLTGVKTKKRAERLIRGTYHKQAYHFNSINSGIGYVEKTVAIKGEEVEIFALLEKASDGEINVILKPFDVKSMFTVEFDVLADVKAELAAQK